MKVKDAIEFLKKFHNPDEEIVIAWWEKEDMNVCFERKIPTKVWNKVCDYVSSYFDWSYVNNQLEDEIEEYLDGEGY